MTTDELENHVKIIQKVNDTIYYKVSVRNVWYHASTKNLTAYERIQMHEKVSDTIKVNDLSYRQALLYLYNIGKPNK